MAEAHVVRDGRSNLFLVKVFTVSIFLLPVRIQPEEEQVEESRGVHSPSPGLSERAPHYLTKYVSGLDSLGVVTLECHLLLQSLCVMTLIWTGRVNTQTDSEGLRLST